MLSCTVEPGSICLSGQIFTPASMVLPSPTTTSSPITAPSSRSELFLMVACRQTIACRRREFSPMYE